MPGTTVDGYIEQVDARMRATIEAARALVRSTAPDSEELMMWGAPVYKTSSGKPSVYLAAWKDHVNLGFFHGADLPDPERLLLGSGKEGRHIKLRSPDDLANEAISALIRAALA